MNRYLTAGVAILALSGCARQTQGTGGEFHPVASVMEVMQAITIPAADAVWGAGGDPPSEAAQWLAIENSALALAESGNLLLMEPRVPDRGNWAEQARAMIAAAAVAATAARGRDLDGLLEAGDAIYETCAACHAEYMIRP